MTTPRSPRRNASRTPRGVGKVLAAVGLPLAFASMLSLTHCDTDGVTPVCPAEGGGDCITPPGMSSASVVITTTGGPTGTGGSGGATPDAGLSSVLDAALDIQLGQ